MKRATSESVLTSPLFQVPREAQDSIQGAVRSDVPEPRGFTSGLRQLPASTGGL